MRRFIAFIVALAAVPSNAQDTGTLIQRSPAQVDFRSRNAARLLTAGWARCIVQQSPKRVEAYLATPLGSKDSTDFAKRFLFGMSECISGGDVEQRQLRMSMTITRAALFEALYHRRFGKDERNDFAAVPPLDLGKVSALPPEAQQVVAMTRFGECVIRHDAKGVRALLVTAPGDDAEARALGTLMPQLSACLPKGTPFTFSRTLVRGALAEPLYKLSLTAEARQTARQP